MNWINRTVQSVNANSQSKVKQRQFGFLLIVVLLLIVLVSVYKQGFAFNFKQSYTLVGIGVVFLVTIVFPKLFYPFLFGWLLLGNILGEISSFLILLLVYYFLFFPISSVLKVTQKKKTITGWRFKENNIDYEKLY